MDILNVNQEGPQPCGQSLKSLAHRSEPDVVEILAARQVDLQSKLDDVNNALKALQDNPQVANVLKLVSKASRY